MKLILALFAAASAHLSIHSCDFSKAKLTKETKLSTGVIKLGTLQVSAKNQDPIVAYEENGKQLFCRSDYDTTATDARAVAATADKEHLYIAFSVDGGANGKSFTRFTREGWQPSYGNGGGAKVLVILKIRKVDGEPVAGTYLIAQKGDGKTNSVALKGIIFAEGKLEVTADTWFSPLKHDKSRYSCEGKSPFRYMVRLDVSLKNVLATDAQGCK